MLKKDIKQSRKHKFQANKKFVWITIAITIMVILFDLSPFGGNIRFYSKWVQCGHRPLQTQSWEGSVPWYEEAPIFQPILRGDTWYCTPLDAERAGYSANRHYFDFPHLRAAGEKNKYMQN